MLFTIKSSSRLLCSSLSPLETEVFLSSSLIPLFSYSASSQIFITSYLDSFSCPIFITYRVAIARFRGILQNKRAEEPFGKDFIYNLARFRFFSAYSNIFSLEKLVGYHWTPLFLSSSWFLIILTLYNPLPNDIAKDLSVLH